MLAIETVGMSALRISWLLAITVCGMLTIISDMISGMLAIRFTESSAIIITVIASDNTLLKVGKYNFQPVGN